MNIALDLDGTALADPVAFKAVVAILRRSGHKVFIVTMRYASECAAIRREWGPLVDDIITTDRKAKKPATKALGVDIHVWIDDEPRAINEDATAIWSIPSPEGQVIVVDHDKQTTQTETIVPDAIYVR